jgi:hypothetical protein
MLNTNDVLNKVGQRLVEKIKDALSEKDLTGYGPSVATGNLINSIRYEVDSQGVTVFGLKYIGALENGRKPTENGGNGELKAKIRQWIDVKGIEPDGISKDSLAYLITRKIHREGTSIYQRNNGESSGLLDDVLTDQTINELSQELMFAYVTDIKSEVRKGIPIKMLA